MIFRRIHTKADKRARAKREGSRNPVVGYAEKRRRQWAVRTLIQKQGDRCALCGEAMNLREGDAREATIDHILPIAAGGTDAIGNLQLACRGCNQAKGATVPEGEP